MSQAFGFSFDTPPEDFPVTFQVALGAEDGWLIASDTLENRFAGAASYPAIRETRHVDKISYHSKTLTAFTSCGDYVMREACRDVIEMYERQYSVDYPTDFDDFTARLKAIGNERWAKEEGAKQPPQFRRAIFAFRHSRPFWTLELPNPRHETSQVEFAHNRIYNGEVTSPAKFFIEQYHSDLIPVRSLLPLASHTILTGGRLNSSGVGGLQILFCEKNKITNWRYGTRELRSLIARSDAIYKSLRGRLLKK